MTADRDVTPIVRSWLEQRGQGLADPHGGFDRFLELVDTTPQVRRRWWAPGRSGDPAHPIRRSPSMFSATRLIAAIAVVALGTGALFFAASPGPAPVASPSPMPTPALTFREVEPHVMKVVGDGAGHELDGMPLTAIATGPDDTVWLVRATGGYGSADGLLVLGEPGIASAGPLERHEYVDLAVAPDGTLWGVGQSWARGSGGGPASFDGDAWTLAPVPGEVHGVEVAPDGSIWAAWIGRGGTAEAGRLGPDGWQAFDSSASPTDVDDGLSLAVGADDDVWLGSWYGNRYPQGWVGLLHSDGAAWTVEHLVGPRDDLSAGPMAIGPDGTLWVYLATSTTNGLTYADPERYLARRDADGWTVFSGEDGVPLLVGGQMYAAQLAVAEDGTLWIAFNVDAGPDRLPPELGPQAPEGCPGVLSFDGSTWRQYLVGTCINAVAFAPDGQVWATARTGRADDTTEVPDRAGLYLIRPGQGAAE